MVMFTCRELLSDPDVIDLVPFLSAPVELMQKAVKLHTRLSRLHAYSVPSGTKSLMSFLGQGSFAMVYRHDLPSGEKVAMKCWKKAAFLNDAYNPLMIALEAEIMEGLGTHSNIVGYTGVSPFHCAIVLECCEGSLEDLFYS